MGTPSKLRLKNCNILYLYCYKSDLGVYIQFIHTYIQVYCFAVNIYILISLLGILNEAALTKIELAEEEVKKEIKRKKKRHFLREI